MRVRHGLAMGGIESAPAAAGQIDFRPGMQVAPLALQIALLVAAGEARGHALGPAAINEQHGQVAARPAAALQGMRRTLRRAGIAMHVGEVGE
jgi:hypothetical protein